MNDLVRAGDAPHTSTQASAVPSNEFDAGSDARWAPCATAVRFALGGAL
jgi:hypothetical protein